jgi:hypothetical protein
MPRWDRLLGAAIGLLTAAALTYQGSQQALGPAPEPVQGQSVFAASGSQLAGFALPALRPGDHGDQCAAVVYRHPEAAQMRVYAADLAATRGLGQLIQLRVESGRLAAHSAGCANFTPGHTVFEGALAAFPRTSASAGAAIALAGSGQDEVAIRVSYTFSNAATNAAQGGTARLRLAYGIEAATS